MDLLAHVGRRVRELREQRGMSQLELAQAAGVSARQLARLEGGSANLTLTTLEALAGALGTRAALLLPKARPAAANRKSVEALAEAAEDLTDADLLVIVGLVRLAAKHRLPLAGLLKELNDET